MSDPTGASTARSLQRSTIGGHALNAEQTEKVVRYIRKRCYGIHKSRSGKTWTVSDDTHATGAPLIFRVHGSDLVDFGLYRNTAVDEALLPKRRSKEQRQMLATAAWDQGLPRNEWIELSLAPAVAKSVLELLNGTKTKP
jgi:hypothetical protein